MDSSIYINLTANVVYQAYQPYISMDNFQSLPPTIINTIILRYKNIVLPSISGEIESIEKFIEMLDNYTLIELRELVCICITKMMCLPEYPGQMEKNMLNLKSTIKILSDTIILNSDCNTQYMRKLTDEYNIMKTNYDNVLNMYNKLLSEKNNTVSNELVTKYMILYKEFQKQKNRINQLESIREDLFSENEKLILENNELYSEMEILKINNTTSKFKKQTKKINNLYYRINNLNKENKKLQSENNNLERDIGELTNLISIMSDEKIFMDEKIHTLVDDILELSFNNGKLVDMNKNLEIENDEVKNNCKNWKYKYEKIKDILNL